MSLVANIFLAHAYTYIVSSQLFKLSGVWLNTSDLLFSEIIEMAGSDSGVETVVENVDRDGEGATAGPSNHPEVAAPAQVPDQLDASSVSELIWRKFVMIDDGKAKCRKCSQILKVSNTTGMQRHLEKKHRKEFICFEKEKEKLKKLKDERLRKFKTTPIGDVSGGKKLKQAKFAWQVEDKALQRRFMDALVDYAADSFSSFRQLSSDAFKRLVHVLNPNVKVMSRQALSEYVKKAAADVLKQVVKKIQEEKEDLVGVAFTTDMWTARNGDSFMSLTVHYIDRMWELQRWTAHVMYFPEAHTGKLIKIALDKMIEDIGLEDIGIKKYAVNDSAANAKKVGFEFY